VVCSTTCWYWLLKVIIDVFFLFYLKFLHFLFPHFSSISFYFQLKYWFSNFLKVSASVSRNLNSLRNEIGENFEIKKFKKLG
jgi:hypothetical protein